MGGFMEDKAAEMLENVMERKGIKPGELLSRIEKTLELIDNLAPVAKDMSETSSELEHNVTDLQNQMEKFNNNSNDMVEAMNGLSETLEKFHDLFEDVERE